MHTRSSVRAVWTRHVPALLLLFFTSTIHAAPADDFVTTWQTDNPGTTDSTSIRIPFMSGLYDIDWDNDGVFDELGLSFTANHDFGVAGTYTIRIRGTFNGINFGGGGDVKKLIRIDQWGTHAWTTAQNLFLAAINLEVTASDTPDFSAVTDMSGMFKLATLANPDTSNWNTAAVTTMAGMFSLASNADPDVSGWNVAMVNDMSSMFQSAASANPDVSGWNTASLTNTNSMFKLAAAATPDISGWDVSGLLDAAEMFFLITLPDTLYDSILISWAAQSLQPAVSFGAGNSTYCSTFAANSRDNIILSYSWTISDAGQNCTTGDAFIMTWDTRLAGVSNLTSIKVPMVGGPYEVDWDNDGIFDQSGINGAITHNFGGLGQYTIRVRGGFDTIQVFNTDDKLKLLSVDQWGTHVWSSMAGAFWGAQNLVIAAEDIPDLSSVGSLQRMFMGAAQINPDVSNWNTSAVNNMASVFRNTPMANPDIDGWETSAVTTMANMFLNASSFNRDLSGWNIGLLSNATSMFDGSDLSAGNYDRLLSGWEGQTHLGGVTLGAADTGYCSAAAASARTTLMTTDSWTITDAGAGCASAPPAPDLLADSDTGKVSTDNITMDNTPTLDVLCSSADDEIKLYTNKPTALTLLETHNCSSSVVESVTVGTPMTDNQHTVTYTRTLAATESSPSPGLFLTIDTLPPTGPGSLISPASSTRDVMAQLTGTCGIDAGSGTAKVTTVPANGFNSLYYNQSLFLFLGGEITLNDPDWNDGSWDMYFDCTDVAGNTAAQFGPFGPVIVETSCSGTDVVIRADFPAGSYRCQGSSTITTSGLVTLEPGSIVYFQSPDTLLDINLSVQQGASFTSSTTVGNAAPHIAGPEQLQATIGDTVFFGDTQDCIDYEDGSLSINPVDSGSLAGPAGSEIFVLDCIDLDGAITLKAIEIIKN